MLGIGDEGQSGGESERGMAKEIHLALQIHHSQPILVVFQVEESVFGRPNHRGRRSQAIGAGVEHPIPNTEIHGENGPEKRGGKHDVM